MAALKKMPGRACSRHGEDCDPLQRGSTNSQSGAGVWKPAESWDGCGQMRTSGLQLRGRAPA